MTNAGSLSLDCEVTARFALPGRPRSLRNHEPPSAILAIRDIEVPPGGLRMPTTIAGPNRVPSSCVVTPGSNTASRMSGRIPGPSPAMSTPCCSRNPRLLSSHPYPHLRWYGGSDSGRVGPHGPGGDTLNVRAPVHQAPEARMAPRFSGSAGLLEGSLGSITEQL